MSIAGKKNQGDNPPGPGGQQPPAQGQPQQQQQQRPQPPRTENPSQGPPRDSPQQQQPQRTQLSGDQPRPAKGAWKEKQKQKPKGQDQSSSGTQQPPQKQQQQVPSGGPQQQQQQQPRPASVASQSSQRSDSSTGARPRQQPRQQQQQPKVEEISSKMKQLSTIDIDFPVRDSVTKTSNKFKKERIGTNYLNLKLQQLPDTIYHYDIRFDPDRPKKFMIPAFRVLIAQHLPKQKNRVAFDGVNSFYSMDKIKDAQFEVTVPSPDAGKEKTFKIAIKFATNVDMRVIKHYNSNYTSNTTTQQAIQTLDIVLRSAFDRDDLIRHKRSVFAPPSERNRMFMKDNYELYIGLYQSFVMGERPFLNVDVAHKAFPSAASDLIPLLNQYRNFDEILSGLNLVYTSPMTQEKRMYKFNGIRGSADREMFNDDSDGRRKSIVQYFQEKGYRVKHPNLPCLHIGPPNRNILIPIELLSLPGGQALNRKAPESCTRDMVRIAATSTDVRKSKIMDLLRNINYKNVETIRHFGLTVGEDFIDVESHILNPPKLQYQQNEINITRPGQWEMTGTKFLKPHTCTNWGILVLDNKINMGKVNDFGENFVKMAQKHGLTFAPFTPTNVERPNKRLDKQSMDNIINNFKRNKIELLFVIIAPFGDQYQDVKKSAELRCGMLTQCLKSGTVDRMNPSTLSNILLKVNSKLGGSNQMISRQSQVSIGMRPHMVIGADVTHPSPEQRNIPSVVGVAASYDTQAFRYNCQWRIQSPRDETIRDLETIVVQHLNVFKATHKILPKHILYYRDGVSEGQFAEIKNIELSAIQRACKTVGGPECDIKITVIVVQKRHHTRFFPKKPNPLDRKNNNVTPGTVVDSEIVDTKNKWQFFMVSHASIQGVAKPTKYCIIHDDANVSNEDLQVFTYNLCHLFTRCNRSVSYVAPTYYAHLVAYRGRVYIHK